MLSAINNYIKNQPVNSCFFKGIMILPVVGHLVQIWKRTILVNELNGIAFDEKNKCDANADAVFKMREIVILGKQSFKYGTVADVSMIIARFVLIGVISPFVTKGLFIAGYTSIIARKFGVEIYLDWPYVKKAQLLAPLAPIHKMVELLGSPKIFI